jgi:protein arginine kinase activator
MKCDSCGGNDAIIHIRQIIGSEVKDLHVCQKCAAEKGILTTGDKTEFSLPDILGGLVDAIPVVNSEEPDNCPVCGLKREDVDKESRVGCPECINVFAREVRRALKKRGYQPGHTGKLPHNLETVKKLLFDKEILKNELVKAVSNEDYERAAHLRDRIRAIEDNAGVPHER